MPDCADEVRSSVWPSGSLRAAAPAASVPPAPPRFSTTTECPIWRASGSATRRPIRSLVAPGVAMPMKRRLRVGNVCSAAIPYPIDAIASSATKVRESRSRIAAMHELCAFDHGIELRARNPPRQRGAPAIRRRDEALGRHDLERSLELGGDFLGRLDFLVADIDDAELYRLARQ